MVLDYSELDSFVVLMALEGAAIMNSGEGNQTTLNAGETVLLPATTQTVKIEGNIKFLETFV